MPSLVPDVLPPGSLSASAQPTLKGGELFLRPWRSADAPALVSAYADPDIQRWHSRSMSEDEAAAWIERRHAGWRQETHADWAVVEADELVGRVGLRSLLLAEGSGEVAYWVMAPARGRRVAARALRIMSGWLLDEMGLHRLELNHATANNASCRVAEQSGYALEGTKRQQALHADGWHDMHAHARLRDDRPHSRRSWN